MIDFNKLSEELKGRGFDVDSIRDKLGKPIEEKIKPLVIALNYLGYKTSQSCQGHSLYDILKRMRLDINNGRAKLVYFAESGLTFKFKRNLFYWETKTFNENPWVDVSLTQEQSEGVERILQEHEDDTGISWKKERIYEPNYHRLFVVPKYSLEQMQNDISYLAKDFITSRLSEK